MLELPVSLGDWLLLGEDVAEGRWESVLVDDCEEVGVALALRVELGDSLGVGLALLVSVPLALCV